MIFEDQYGVGDVIDTGEAIGTVEEVGLRVMTAGRSSRCSATDPRRRRAAEGCG